MELSTGNAVDTRIIESPLEVKNVHEREGEMVNTAKIRSCFD